MCTPDAEHDGVDSPGTDRRDIVRPRKEVQRIKDQLQKKLMTQFTVTQLKELAKNLFKERACKPKKRRMQCPA
jgi:hypothetical protein